tara:strand:- start:1531 stop:2340 length:810 start_codon:yes stop_codon:yes gene_type:complete
MKRLGGTALFSSLTTPKNGELIKWFEAVLEDSQVEIRKGFLADKKSILSLNPDAVVIATGSKSSKSDIRGSDLPHVLSRDQLRGLLQGSKSLYRHENSKTSNFLLLQIDKKLGILKNIEKIRFLSKFWMPLGKRVTIIGGGLVGIELSHFLSERKRQVTVVDNKSVMAPEMAHPRRWRTLHEITSSNVELYNDVEVVEINKNSVICLKGMEEFEIFSDSVILAEGIEADKALNEKFADLEVETHVIGDAESIGYIEGAIRSGNKVGRLL